MRVTSVRAVRLRSGVGDILQAGALCDVGGWSPNEEYVLDHMARERGVPSIVIVRPVVRWVVVAVRFSAAGSNLYRLYNGVYNTKRKTCENQGHYSTVQLCTRVSNIDVIL